MPSYFSLKRICLWFAILFSFGEAALPKHALANHHGICRTLLHNIWAELIEKKHGKDLRHLYDYIYHPVAYHPQKIIKNKAYEIFKENLNWEIFNDVRSKSHKDKKRIIEALWAMAPEEKSKLLTNYEHYTQWMKELIKEQENNDFIYYKGKKVYKAFFERTMELQKHLENQGILTEFRPGHVYSGEEEGQGLLFIKALTSSKHKQILPGKPVLQSKEFQTYLNKAHHSLGAIAIDPTLSGRQPIGYFLDYENIYEDTHWIIGLRPNISGSWFVHEWAHKEDFIDHKGIFPSSLFQRELKKPKTFLGRAIQLTGTMFEKNYISELNATARQFKLYFETKQMEFSDLYSISLYRSSNERKVALGRIFVNPGNPRHYLLYVKSRGQYYHRWCAHSFRHRHRLWNYRCH